MTKVSPSSAVPEVSVEGFPSLPEDWAITRLGELFEIQQGKALNAKHRRSGNQHPFLRTANVFWGRLDLRTLDQMAFSEEEELRLALKRDDLLTCEGGDIGRTAIWREVITPCYYQNHLHRLRRRRDDVEPEFFMRWMEAAIRFLGLYGGAGNKTTIPNLSKSRLANFTVPLPQVGEQQAIAVILRTIQDAKEAADRVIAAARQLKASLLGHTFTYGFVPPEDAEQVETSSTVCGTIPAHWTTDELGDLLTVAQYGLSKRGSSSGGYPMLRMNNLRDGKVVVSDDAGGLQYVELTDDEFQKFRLLPQDLLFNRTNSAQLVGKTGLFDLEDGEYVFASYLIRLRVDSTRLDPRYVNHYLNMGSTQNRLRMLASRGVSQSNINATKLKHFAIPVAPVDEQRQIADVIDTLDAKVQAEEARRTALDILFRTMLHHLMTGKVRLPEFVTSQ